MLKKGQVLNAANLNAAFISKTLNEETISGVKRFSNDLYSTKLIAATNDWSKQLILSHNGTDSIINSLNGILRLQNNNTTRLEIGNTNLIYTSDSGVSIGLGKGNISTFQPADESSYGIKVTADSDAMFIGLKDYGSDRKDAVLQFGDNPTENFRIQYWQSSSGLNKEIAIFKADGKVGIGTTDPKTIVHIEGHGISNYGSLYIKDPYTPNGNQSRGPHIIFGDNSSETRGLIGFYDSVNHGSGTSLNIKSSGTIVLTAGGISGANQITLDTSGNLGIGTTSPTSKLHVVGTAYIEQIGGASTQTIKFGNAVSIDYVLADRKELAIRNLDKGLRFTDVNDWDYNKWAGIKYKSSNTTMYIGGPAATSEFNANASPPNIDVQFVGINNVIVNGKLGVGTTSPSETFHVVGKARVENLSLYSINQDPILYFNAYYNSGDKYIANGTAYQIWNDTTNSKLRIRAATSGSAGSAITFNEGIVIDTSGNVAIKPEIGTATYNYSFYVNGSVGITSYLEMPATSSGDRITINNTSGGWTGIKFNSGVNFGSDFGYIRYYDDVSSFYSDYDINSGNTENSALVIGVENDPEVRYGDLLVLRGGNKVIIDAATINLTGPSKIVEFRSDKVEKASIDTSGNLTANTLKSTASTGTKPLVVASTTLVDNLNADMLDGFHAEALYKNTAIKTNEKTNLAVGWYTIAVNNGNRAVARFGITDKAGGMHQEVIFYATHMYGTDSSNTITVLSQARYDVTPFRYIRIKENGTYDGAALQVYIDDANNVVQAYILGDNIQADGWFLKDWIPDTTDPGDVTGYANFTEKTKIDLDLIQQGGLMTTTSMLAQNNLYAFNNIFVGDGNYIGIPKGNPSINGDLEHFIELRGTGTNYPEKLGIVFHHEDVSTAALIHSNTDANTSRWSFITDDTYQYIDMPNSTLNVTGVINVIENGSSKVTINNEGVKTNRHIVTDAALNNKFSIEYNATDDCLDFIYLG